MNNDFKTTWETYTTSWNVEDTDSKRKIFETCLDSQCVYKDPMASAQNWDELLGYMAHFHGQFPGATMETQYFSAHNNQSIAKWHMKNGDILISEGISYGKYNDAGKLVSMTGFFETP